VTKTADGSKLVLVRRARVGPRAQRAASTTWKSPTWAIRPTRPSCARLARAAGGARDAGRPRSSAADTGRWSPRAPQAGDHPARGRASSHFVSTVPGAFKLRRAKGPTTRRTPTIEGAHRTDEADRQAARRGRWARRARRARALRVRVELRSIVAAGPARHGVEATPLTERTGALLVTRTVVTGDSGGDEPRARVPRRARETRPTGPSLVTPWPHGLRRRERHRGGPRRRDHPLRRVRTRARAVPLGPLRSR
jgi:hypothetical protein